MFTSQKNLYKKGTLEYAKESLIEFQNNEPSINWCIVYVSTHPQPYCVSMLKICNHFWPERIVYD